MNKQNPVRFGLIGYGAWGRHHARAIQACAGAALAGVVETAADARAEAAAAFPGVPIHAELGALLADPAIAVVSVVLPNDGHLAAGSAVLAAGKHLFMEKPLTLTAADSEVLVRQARAAGRLLAAGHQLRVSALWGKAKELIAAGAIGDPLYALIELWRNPYRPGAAGWRYEIDRVGSWILEEPIHFLDLARWYFAACGEPVSVYARANSRQPGRPALQDNFSAVLNFSGGAYAVISQTLSAYEHHQVAKITGTRGALWATWSGAQDRTFHPTFSLHHHAGGQVTPVPLDRPSGEVFELGEEYAWLVDSIRTGRPLWADGEDGRRAVALCEQAQASVRTGRVVNL